MIKLISNLSAILIVLVLLACSTTVTPSDTTQGFSTTESIEAEQKPPKLLLSLQGYDVSSNTALGLTLLIYEDDSDFQYKLISGNDVYTSHAEIISNGDFSLETVQEVKLLDIPWVDNPGESSPAVELMNSEYGLVFENYGNSMNYFQILPLDYKYIAFRPIGD